MADARALVGRWVHAHEEDDAHCRVFRRPDHPLPPSRGRAELDILPDLTVRRTGPGGDDRPASQGVARIGFDPPAGEGSGYLRAVDVADGRLRIAKE